MRRRRRVPDDGALDGRALRVSPAAAADGRRRAQRARPLRARAPPAPKSRRDDATLAAADRVLFTDIPQVQQAGFGMANSLRGSVPAAVTLSALTDRRLIVDWPDVARNFDAVSGASLFPSREPRDDEWWRPKNATTAWQEPGGRPADAADDEEVRLDRLRAPGAARFVSVATRAGTERQRSLCASWTRAWSRAPRDTAASPRCAASDYPRGTRGGAARRLRGISRRTVAASSRP